VDKIGSDGSTKRLPIKDGRRSTYNVDSMLLVTDKAAVKDLGQHAGASHSSARRRHKPLSVISDLILA
jgi:hypothetical protein